MCKLARSSLSVGALPARRSPQLAETTSHTELISQLQKSGKFVPPVISGLAPFYIPLIFLLVSDYRSGVPVNTKTSKQGVLALSQ